MKPVLAVSFIAALACHALLLFGFKLGTNASPLAVSDDPSPVDVSLVAAAPGSPPAESAVTPVPTPEPAPTPQPPAPQPTPEMSTPPPLPPPVPDREMAPAPAPAPASTPQPSRQPPVPHPRVQKYPRNIAVPRPLTNQGAAHPATAANGPADTAVRYRSNPRPDYPEEARRQHQEGVVLLSVEVSPEGRAAEISIRSSSGSDLLDQAAIKAVRRWTFEPARVASLPIASRVDVPIRFSLSQ